MQRHDSKFWMVKGGGPSSAIHETRQIAENEAQRLARINPGERFFVMEAIAYHVRNETQRVALESDPYDQSQCGCYPPCGDPYCDGIPF